MPFVAADKVAVITIMTDFSALTLPLQPLLVFSALIPPSWSFLSLSLNSLDRSCHAVSYNYIPLVPSTLVTDSLSSPATLHWLQSALLGSTATAAASRVHSACTAPARAITSPATVSASLASRVLCATKASGTLVPVPAMSLHKVLVSAARKYALIILPLQTNPTICIIIHRL